MSYISGIKIQARNEYFMNPSIPTRDEVRRSNYLRRRAQLTSEGFHSKIWKPYIDIGHPLKLDVKLEVSVSEKETPEVVIDECLSTVDTVKSVKAIVTQNETSHRKDTEKFQQLEKVFKNEIKKSDDINFNVRVGQSFFGLMQKEKNDKIKEQIRQQKLKGEINPPECDSDSDVESEFLALSERDPSRPATSVMKSRLKARPFTPIYNNISSLPSRATNRPKSVYSSSTNMSDSTNCDIDEASLYRQLCSLHWLLKAMVHDDANNMPRISLSWTVKTEKNKDNDLTSAKNRTEIKAMWEKFDYKSKTLADVAGKEEEHRSKSRRPGATSTQSRPDLQTIADTDDVQLPASSISSRSLAKANTNVTSADRISSVPYSKVSRRRQLQLKMRSVCDELDKEDNDYNDRKSIHLIKIGKSPTVKCRTPQATILQEKDFYSDKLENMVRRNRAKSAQLIDERMTELRDNVKNMSEYKMIVCSNKFKDVQTRGPFHNMLKEFRYKNDYHTFFTALDAAKNKVIYADWFLALEDFLKDYIENKRIQDILTDIRQYALITVTKINTNRFLAVLRGLTDWEIRHPEISASIKFITDHVALMSEEAYQQWFNKTF